MDLSSIPELTGDKNDLDFFLMEFGDLRWIRVMKIWELEDFFQQNWFGFFFLMEFGDLWWIGVMKMWGLEDLRC